jgi:hypothetical protein
MKILTLRSRTGQLQKSLLQVTDPAEIRMIEAVLASERARLRQAESEAQADDVDPATEADRNPPDE